MCNDKARTAQSCCFGFFNADFKLTLVHLRYVFWSGSLYARNLPKVNGKEIIVTSPSTSLIFFP